MKKILFSAAMLAAITFASCNKEESSKADDVELTTLTLKISGIESDSRAIGSAIEDGTTVANLADGQVFVIDPLDNVTSSVELNKDEATSAEGQKLMGIPSDSRIYVVGNIKTLKSDIGTLSKLAELKTTAINITDQADHMTPVLSNSSNDADLITNIDDKGNASINVPIRPLISRVELAKVSSDETVTAFTVDGVYLDDYYPSFGLYGDPIGTQYEQKTSTDFSTVIHKDENLALDATGTPLTSANADSKVWNHNITPNSLPRFIIKLTNVKYKDEDGNEVDTGSTPYYLTVSGYKDETACQILKLLSGNVYKVGGADGITFSKDDLSLTPNPGDVDLILTVSIDPWKVVSTDVDLK